MIERKTVNQKIKEYQIQEYITNTLQNVGHSHTKLQRTPLGDKVIIFASQPGLIVGRKGQNIKKLTDDLKALFSLENPQIEISEVQSPNLDAKIVGERIAASLERFGAMRFKAIVHKAMTDVINAKALGIEVVISGKVPSTRAKSWRFFQGYMKKCGDVALTGISKAKAVAKLKSGIIGIKVSIMPPTTLLPDRVTILDEETVEQNITADAETRQKEAEVKKQKKRKPKKKKDDKETAEPAEESSRSPESA